MVIIHACLKACPSALCLSIESWICVIVTCVYFTCPCWISWYAVMNGLNLTCHSSAMLFPPCWLLLNCLCHPKLNEASMIQLSLFSCFVCFFHCHLIVLHFCIFILTSLHGLKWNYVPSFHCKLDLSQIFEQWTNAIEMGFAALLILILIFLGWN